MDKFTEKNRPKNIIKEQTELKKRLEVEITRNREEKRGLFPNLIPCRLRVEGTWGLLCGMAHHCLMLNRTMNVQFLDSAFFDQQYFRCEECPNPETREELLELVEDFPDCFDCIDRSSVSFNRKNIGTKKVTRKIKQVDGVVTTEEVFLCLSCYESFLEVEAASHDSQQEGDPFENFFT
jgi:hypothetical protein